MISVNTDQTRREAVNRLAERQTSALEAIADHLSAIEAKLDRVARVLEHRANPATHPF